MSEIQEKIREFKMSFDIVKMRGRLYAKNVGTDEERGAKDES